MTTLLRQNQYARINSAKLPKLTLSRPPMDGPTLAASCCVAPGPVGKHADSQRCEQEEPGTVQIGEAVKRRRQRHDEEQRERPPQSIAHHGLPFEGSFAAMPRQCKESVITARPSVRFRTLLSARPGGGGYVKHSLARSDLSSDGPACLACASEQTPCVDRWMLLSKTP